MQELAGVELSESEQLEEAFGKSTVLKMLASATNDIEDRIEGLEKLSKQMQKTRHQKKDGRDLSKVVTKIENLVYALKEIEDSVALEADPFDMADLRESNGDF